MIQTIPVECEMRRAMPPTFHAMEEFISDFAREVRPRLHHSEHFSVELVLREALTNAVVHGCRGEAGRQVRCSVRLKRGRLLIAVADDGDGFDRRAKWTTQARVLDCSGRGVEILRKYATHVRYNALGNAVAIIKLVKENTNDSGLKK